MKSKLERERKAFLSALKHVSDDEGYTIGSYTGKLEQENNRLQKENETLIAANDDLKKEILILENKLGVRYEGD